MSFQLIKDSNALIAFLTLSDDKSFLYRESKLTGAESQSPQHLISTIFSQMVYFLLQHLTYLLKPGLQQLPNALSLSYVIKESDCQISITKETMQNSSNMADA